MSSTLPKSPKPQQVSEAELLRLIGKSLQLSQPSKDRRLKDSESRIANTQRKKY